MAQKVTKNNTETTTSKLVDELLSQVDPSEILSKNGLFSKLKKQLIERVLQSEIEHELGYDKHSKKVKKSSNRRNGSCDKTIIDNEGNKMPIEVPRDREGEYDPQLVPKGIRRFKGFDDQVISLYGRGMTVGGALILDDSIQEKPYTDENEIMCWHYSHAKSRHVKGANLLSCIVQYDDVSIPIGYEIVHKDVSYSEIETKKVKRKASVTKNEHFRNLLNQVYSNKVLFEWVLADNWFGAKENLEYINNVIKKKFIIGIKSNRTVALLEKEKLKGDFTKVSKLDLEDGQSIKVWVKGIDFALQLIKKVFTNEDGSTGVLCIISNDQKHDADYLYMIYQKRWKIELYHKSIKQNASLAASPTKRVLSQANHIFSSLVAFCKLELLKIKTAANHFAIKHLLLLKANQAAFLELQNLKNSSRA